MVESYDLIFFVSVYSGSIALVLIFVVLSLIVLIEYLQKKNISYKSAKFALIIICLIGLYLLLPWWFLAFAVQDTIPEVSENFYKLAAKTAVFPSVKSYMYSSLGSYYYHIAKQGEPAISSHENALRLDGSQELCDVGNKDKMTGCKEYIFSSLFNLCDLYTSKGEIQKGVRTCELIGLSTYAAANYILVEDYVSALEVMNKKIDMNKKKQRSDGINYATRAHILEKLGRKLEAEKDYNTALSISKYPAKVNEIKNNKNYYKDMFTRRKVEYGF